MNIDRKNAALAIGDQHRGLPKRLLGNSINFFVLRGRGKACHGADQCVY